MRRALRAALVGLPNAGKSVLVNALVGEKVSIATRKAQTTRRDTLGVFTDKEAGAQLLLWDSPGVTRGTHGRWHKTAKTSGLALVEQSDVVLLVVDAVRRVDDDTVGLAQAVVERAGDRAWLVLNKMDLVQDARRPEFVTSLLRSRGVAVPQRTFLVSGQTKRGIDELRGALVGSAGPGEWEFEDPEQRHAQSDVDMATEAVREQLYNRFHEDLPYTMVLENPEVARRRAGNINVRMDVVVRNLTQKKMVIGKNGEGIEAVRTRAAADLVHRFKCPVYVHLSVRARK